ncbi:beta-propeller domain-containing protein [Paenibacillus allorhizosphaerae]|uniref:Copper amine oxidase-like N-terminal domain-containing protein n=1 Tax=Paenibacillus allorhizosphaerae TaxID=2849866 RepID=A0ABM8VMY2_9BACL|nr:beta-propeller domain-containing protein [Paenibacillus allorhizosphaerae]CAG7650635.1 hypothetical protein PAECIP111802_04769 [Paenibacillus allorhizosphaerae]
MRKSTLVATLLALALLTSAAPVQPSNAANAEKGIAVQLNGNPIRLAVAPRLVGSTLMIPLRDISESLGVSISWDDGRQTVTAAKGDRTIRLTVGSKEALRGNAAVQLEEGPLLENGTLLVPLRFFSESYDFNVYWDGLNQTVSIVDADKSLPTVGSLERMQELLRDSPAASSYRSMAKTMVTMDSAATESKAVASVPAAAGSSGAGANGAGAGAPSYSGTNVQVEGVDEADVIKTDGTYIYQVNRDRVIVSQAYPAESMSVVSTVYWADPNFNPREIYVDEKQLVVIGNTYYSEKGQSVQPAPAVQPMGPDTAVSSKIAIWPGPRGRSATKAIVYELGDRTNLKPVREAELEGSYISSRKVGDSLYIVANKGINYRIMPLNGKSQPDPASIETPSYRDSAAGDAYIKIGFEDIRYFPKSVEPNYLLVGGISLSQPDQKMQVTSYLGSGQFVYASQNNLYVTVNEYEPAVPPADAAEPASGQGRDAVGKIMLPRPTPMDSNSVIYKFAMNNGLVQYAGRGKVPGHPLNQFSMDESNGNFRIATTSGEIWRNDEYTSKNNLYVLNDAMSITGKIENIAPGERIYSVRYAGNRAYMVTFKNVDPLFVIDLKDPAAPSILGQLKIPGYSDYLHPYDENHIIGFGKDTVEVTSKSSTPGAETTAYYQGMKLAMFDVTDVANPKELFKETIGDRGTDSELLRNHKALLFSKEKNLLAFPVSVAEMKSPSPSTDPSREIMRYGEFTFQGAYVYQLDLTKGFQLRGKITHLSDGDIKKAGRSWYGSDKNIERLLYIGDTLYTSSQSMIKANDLKDLHEIGALTLPPWTPKKP